MSGTTRVSLYQKGKTNLNFTEARDSEWQWRQLGHMQVCISLQTDNYASTPPLSFLQAGCPSCRPTNSVKALKAKALKHCSYKYVNQFVTAIIVIVVLLVCWWMLPFLREHSKHIGSVPSDRQLPGQC